MKLYVHLSTPSSPVIIETLIVILDKENPIINELIDAIHEGLKKKDDGNKVFKINRLHFNRGAANSLSLNHYVRSYFSDKSDVFCTITVEVDLSKHVKPLPKAQLKPIPKKRKREDDGVVFKTLTNYSFYESGKRNVKVIVPFAGLPELKKDQIKVIFKRKALAIKIFNYKGENYQFTVPRLQAKILPERSTYVIKNKEFNLTLRKFKDDDNWFALFRKLCVMEQYSSADEEDLL